MVYRVNTDVKIVDIEFIGSEEDEKNLITLKKFFKAQGYTIFEKYKIEIEVDPMYEYDTGVNIKFITSPGITVTDTVRTAITIPSYSETNSTTK